MDKKKPEIVDQIDIFDQPASIQQMELGLDTDPYEGELDNFDDYPSDKELDFNDKPRSSALEIYEEDFSE